MRALIRWAARLYPEAWRERYAAEFDALLEDIPRHSSTYVMCFVARSELA